MAEFIDSPSNNNERSAWDLPPTVTYRDAIIGTGEIGVCVVRLDPFDWAAHQHPYAQILILFDDVRCEMTWWAVLGGEPCPEDMIGRQICLIAPGVLHAGSWKQKAETLMLLVRPSFIEREFGCTWSGVVVGEFAAVVGKDRMIWHFTSLVRRLCRKREPKEHRLIEELGSGLARRLITVQLGSGVIEPPTVTVLSSAQLHKVTDRIEANWDVPPTVDELASLAALSPRHFRRVFNNTTGITPARYHIICRMRKAEEMLLSGNYRIEEISDALGFSEPNYFSRCFRKFFDMSPTESLEQHRAKMS